MNTSDYRSKLVNQDTYRNMTKDPTQKILRKTTKLIKESSLPPATKKKICTTEARLCGLPKILKDNVPLRLISSALGSTNLQPGQPSGENTAKTRGARQNTTCETLRTLKEYKHRA
ncbi:unnamed protein product [Psylliodes chrysocephalus]|uniref:Uncharacterized protein n=1 Tax=Psylliodes chrysocephalus TaxID=3402493 RepID=A0A9P0D438_9CUCU|nr:unnamed protein product [Psylliodes chrysocephala]